MADFTPCTRHGDRLPFVRAIWIVETVAGYRFVCPVITAVRQALVRCLWKYQSLPRSWLMDSRQTKETCVHPAGFGDEQRDLANEVNMMGRVMGLRSRLTHASLPITQAHPPSGNWLLALTLYDGGGGAGGALAGTGTGAALLVAWTSPAPRTTAQ